MVIVDFCHGEIEVWQWDVDVGTYKENCFKTWSDINYMN